jgi:hypothetical protein
MQAIELSTDILANVKFIQEKKLIAKCASLLCEMPFLVRTSMRRASLTVTRHKHRRYFDEISQDTGKYCFGVDDTLQCLDMGAVETLIVWENLEVCTCIPTAATAGTLLPRSALIARRPHDVLQVNRHVLINHQTNETFVKHLTPEQEKDTSHFVDKETGASRGLSGCRFASVLPGRRPSRRRPDTPADVSLASDPPSPQASNLSRRRSCRCSSGWQTSTSALAASSSARRCGLPSLRACSIGGD